MTAQIVKFPYSVSRRAHARKLRRSKNGTPEERAAKPAAPVVRPHGWNNGHNPLRDKVIRISRAATIVGKVVYRRHNFDAAGLQNSICQQWLDELRDSIADARSMIGDFEKAFATLMMGDSAVAGAGGKAVGNFRLSGKFTGPRLRTTCPKFGNRARPMKRRRRAHRKRDRRRLAAHARRLTR